MCLGSVNSSKFSLGSVFVFTINLSRLPKKNIFKCQEVCHWICGILHIIFDQHRLTLYLFFLSQMRAFLFTSINHEIINTLKLS